MVGHIQVPVKVGHGRHLLEAAAVHDGFMPDVAVSRVIEIVSLDYPEPYFLPALVALYVDEEAVSA